MQLFLKSQLHDLLTEHTAYVLLRGWVDAGGLRPGMAVRQADGEYGAVEQDALVQRAQRRYNLSVADAHTFFVGDDAGLVHKEFDTCVAFHTSN